MERIKIIQVGVNHEHANGKITSLRNCLADEFEVVGFVDSRKFSRSRAIFCCDYNPKMYEGLRELTLEEALNCPGVQAATIEVPNLELVDMGLKFAEKGIAIHLDKTAGEDLNEYRKLLDLCRTKNVPFQMGYMFRGNPAIRYIVEAIKKGWLGGVYEMETDMHHGYGGEPYQDYIRNFKGGLMFNLGSHLIDFIVEALGRPEKVVPFLSSAPDDPDNIYNNCLAVLEYPHTHVTVKTCSRRNVTISDRRILVRGTKGAIELCPVEHFDGHTMLELQLALKEPAGNLPAGRHVLKFPAMRDRYETQLRDFAAMIRGTKNSEFSFEHDCLVQEVTLAASGCIPWETK